MRKRRVKSVEQKHLFNCTSVGVPATNEEMLNKFMRLTAALVATFCTFHCSPTHSTPSRSYVEKVQSSPSADKPLGTRSKNDTTLRMSKTVRGEVQGLVQGVFFRASMQQEAQRLQVVGWVKNQSDGTVLFLAQGEPAHVDELVTWAHHGPPHARVTLVVVKEEICDTGLQGFQIRRDELPDKVGTYFSDVTIFAFVFCTSESQRM
jgi:acylphosphatase